MTVARRRAAPQAANPPQEQQEVDEQFLEEEEEEEEEEEKEEEKEEEVQALMDVPEPPKYRQTPPKFGGLTQTGPSTWVAWTGGKPKADWSELEKINPELIHPNQYRPTSITSQAKCQVLRTKGLDIKFARGADLHTFQKDVVDHLEDHGLDTVTYLEDPTKPGEMVSVITNHGKFTLEEGSKAADDNALVHQTDAK